MKNFQKCFPTKKMTIFQIIFWNFRNFKNKKKRIQNFSKNIEKILKNFHQKKNFRFSKIFRICSKFFWPWNLVCACANAYPGRESTLEKVCRVGNLYFELFRSAIFWKSRFHIPLKHVICRKTMEKTHPPET